MDRDDSNRAFSALLSDLAANVPQSGFQTPADVKLSTSQVATVSELAPQEMTQALAGALPAIGEQLRIAGFHPIAYDGIAAIVVNALTATAQRLTFGKITEALS